MKGVVAGETWVRGVRGLGLGFMVNGGEGEGLGMTLDKRFNFGNGR